MKMPNSCVESLGNGATAPKTYRDRPGVVQKKSPTRDHVFTLGIEEEFQIIDPKTRELRSHIQQILAGGKVLLKEHVKAEMHQSVVELGTEICVDTAAARQQVVQLRSELATIAAMEGLKIASAGTHPFSHWMDQQISTDERYMTILNDMQQIARVNLIWVCMFTSAFPIAKRRSMS